MTKSTITREQLEEWVAQFDEDGGCDATDRQLAALIRQSLAAMDSEPAAPVAEVVSIYGDSEVFGEREIRPLVGIQQMPYGTKLYHHAQPVVEIEPVAEVLSNRPGNDTSTIDRALPVGTQLYRHAQPAPASSVCSCPSGDGSLRWPCPVHPGNSPVIQDSSVIGWIRTDYQQDFQVNCTAPQFIMGANDPSDAWGVKYMPVAKAGGQQNAPQNIPEIIPGWIPVSERLPDEGDHVLVSDGVGMDVSWIRGREWKKLRHIYSEDVTHWMPLPAAPQEPKP